MAVTAEDLRIIKASLPMIREHFEPASERFYDNLFVLAPEMRGLFRSDLSGQGMRFMATLATIAEVLNEPEELEAELAELARSHARLGVRRAHFAPMGAALMVTLGETIGTDFTPDLQSAWRSAFDHIAEQMMADIADAPAGDASPGPA